ncbi:hypothetical protein [Noviherbaspirillum malthae]|uniref:hypothetical protein n=1 Tax=Noviherbaspirillum malthae TaxID=1260987 RepID=UPI00188EA270|nr:hypothetical protein [Noviherbaspirillum malthae]
MTNTMDNGSQNTFKTAGGKILRYLDRVEGVRATREMRLEARVTSWEVDRILRRDFNLVSQKLYRACSIWSPPERSVVRELITEFILHGEYLVGKSSMYEVTREIPAEYVTPVRIISAESNHIYRTLVTADAAMMRLKCAVIDGLITREERTHHFNEAMAPYSQLKLILTGQKKLTKTARQLGEELGIT